ncbi:protein FRIGIDA-like [Nicotiana sylvestris]
MDKPADPGAATPVSQPPFDTQLVSQQQQSESIIANLRNISDSLSAFQHCFSELQRHIDSIRTSIDSVLLPPQTTKTTHLPAPSSAPAAASESDSSEEGGGGGEEEEDEEEEEEEEKVKSPRPDLESFCETMNSDGLRKYMLTHLSDIHGLRVQVPKALKRSPKPARLVLESIGKFYIQGSKGYINDLPLIRGRMAKVLLLELLMGMGFEIDKWVKEEAEQAALAWLKRLNSEGGILQVQEIDARGLLLLIGCFGVPHRFTNANIINLLQVSNLKLISVALRNSHVLMAKFPEIIEEMVKNKRVFDAVHIVYSVGIQDKFNPEKLLTSFLRESKDSFDKMKRSQGSLDANFGVKRKYLSDLNSVIKCLDSHKIDPSKLLPGWQINMKIMSLKREIAEFDKHKQIAEQKIAQQIAELHKRKIDETEWLSNKEVKHSHFPNPWPPQHQRVVNHVNSNNTLLEGGGTAGHNYGYYISPSELHGPVASPLRENVISSGVAMGGPGAGILANADGIHAGMDVVPLGGSYAGSLGGSRVDSTPKQLESHAGQLYGSHGDATVYDRLPSHRYAYRPSSYLEGPNTIAGDTYRPGLYMESSAGLPNTIPGEGSAGLPNTIPGEGSAGLPNTIPGDSNMPPPYLEGSAGLPNTITGNAYRPAPYMESSKGLPNTIPGDSNRPPQYLEGSVGLPNTITGNTYRPLPYLEGSTGLPNTIPPPYQFADTVPATELYQSSGSRAVGFHPSSSLYWQR